MAFVPYNFFENLAHRVRRFDFWIYVFRLKLSVGLNFETLSFPRKFIIGEVYIEILVTSMLLAILFYAISLSHCRNLVSWLENGLTKFGTDYWVDNGVRVIELYCSGKF